MRQVDWHAVGVFCKPPATFLSPCGGRGLARLESFQRCLLRWLLFQLWLPSLCWELKTSTLTSQDGGEFLIRLASAWEQLSTHIHGQSSGWREEALCSTVVCGCGGLSLPTLLKSLCVWRGREVMVGGADPSGKVSWLPQRHPWCHWPGRSGGGSHEIRSLSDTLRGQDVWERQEIERNKRNSASCPRAGTPASGCPNTRQDKRVASSLGLPPVE